MQVKYKDIIIDVKKGTKVNELLKKYIEEDELKPIACRFNNEVKWDKINNGFKNIFIYSFKLSNTTFLSFLFLSYPFPVK